MFLDVEASSSEPRRRSSPPTPTVRAHPRRRSRGRPPPSTQSYATVPLLSLLLLVALSHLSPAVAVTLYNNPSTVSAPTATTTAANVTWTGLPAYDPTVLTPPAPLSPPITNADISLPANGAALTASNLSLSIQQRGNFLGFSIELSVADTLLGKNGGQLKPQMLNYLANIQNRAGAGPVIRVGGNTQDDSTIVPGGFSNGSELQKIKTSTDVTATPIINYSPELLYTMANISSHVHAQWYFGLAFNQTDVDSLSPNIPVAAHYAESILGNNLLGLALGNEPDLYVDHANRPAGWNLTNYISEFDNIASATLANGNLANSMPFVGPAVCCERVGFEVSDLVSAGWLSSNADRLAAVSVQHYPTNNCAVNGNVINAQDIFASFLNHTSATSLTAYYYENSAQVQAAGKRFVMMEMNSASCGGFAGLSDSFGVAMWMTDWALQLAWANFSTALMHVGGQNVYYNPFTPPPSNLSSLYQWTTGSVYYSTLVVAETFGQSNVSRIVDLTNSTDPDAIYHPVYGIYENDAPTRLVLFNYVSDTSGASTLYQSISFPGGTAPSTVSVRYFSAPSASEKYNITWAGQTLGYSFQSDGRLYNTQQTETITCSNGACVVPVYAPSIALVFLTNAALTDSDVPSSATVTYATTVIGTGSATINPQVLSTSNGQNPKSAAGRSANLSGSPMLLALVLVLAAIAWT